MLSSLQITRFSHWLQWSVASQLLLGMYFELCAWVPLGAWNDQPGRDQPVSFGEAAFNLFFGLAPILLSLTFLKGFRVLMWAGLVFYGVWLALQFLGWWVPYLFGASPQHAEMYERVFSRTYKFLPTIGGHLPPDAMHTVLQILLVIVLVSCTRVLLPGGQHEQSST